MWARLLFLSVTLLVKPVSAADWPMFGGDASNSLHQDESAIGPGNVGRLEPKWSVSVPGPLFKTPIVDSSGVYIGTYTHVLRLEKESGAIRWEKSIDQLARECPGLPGEELPTLVSETSPAIVGDKLVFTTAPDLESIVDLGVINDGGGYVLITDKDGNCLKRVLVTNHTFEGILGSSTIHKGIAYMGISSYEEQAASYPGYSCCSTIGKVCAVDIEAGLKKWCTSLVDADPTTPEYDMIHGDINVEGISGVTVWSSAPAIDEKNNQVIVTTGNAYSINANIDPSSFPDKSLPVDAFVAIDLSSGVIKNVNRVVPEDFWNVDCLDPQAGNCEFEPVGPDYDFGAGANIVNLNGTDVAVAINKAGNVYGVRTSDLELLWQTKVGPTTLLGLAGSSTDGSTVYASHPNFFDIDFDLLPESPIVPREWQLQNCPNPDPEQGCPKVYGGILSALDPATGDILWQNSDPSNFIPLPPIGDEFFKLSDNGKTPYLAPPTSTNGVVFQGGIYPNVFLIDDEAGEVDEEAMATIFGQYPNANAAECPFPDYLSGGCMATFPSMFAFDGGSGELLWTFAASGPVIAGAAISDGVVYWGAGTLGEDSTVYAFAPRPPDDSGVGGGPAGGPAAPSPVLGGGGCSLQVRQD